MQALSSINDWHLDVHQHDEGKAHRLSSLDIDIWSCLARRDLSDSYRP